jgi:hypothetical protein
MLMRTGSTPDITSLRAPRCCRGRYLESCVAGVGAVGHGGIGRAAAGVALCRLHATPSWLDGMELMLKGGQMGGDDLFETLRTGR